MCQIRKLCEVLLQSETDIKFYFIPSECIKKIKGIPSLATIPRTLKIHQVVTHARGTIHYRDVSCTVAALMSRVSRFLSNLSYQNCGNNMYVPKGIQQDL